MPDLGRLPFVCGDQPFLVFRRKTVRWAEIVPDFAERTPLVRPFASGRSFASAGGGINGIDGLTITADAIRFDRPGAYNLLTQLGSFKILILPERKSAEDIVSVTRFLSANIVHSGFDVYTCTYGPWLSSTLYYRNLFYKLFHTDQPLGLICGQVSMMLCAMLEILGFRSRQIGLSRPGGEGHLSTEAFDGGRWVLIDADFDCVVRDPETGALLGADAVTHALSLGTSPRLKVESLSRKGWVRGESAFLWGFYGGFTWTPAAQHANLCSDHFLDSIKGMSVVELKTPALSGGWITMGGQGR